MDSASLAKVKTMLEGELEKLYSAVKQDKQKFHADTKPWKDVEAALFMSIPTHWPFTTSVQTCDTTVHMRFTPMIPRKVCTTCNADDAGMTSMTDLEKKEYEISGMCVACQRNFFQ